MVENGETERDSTGGGALDGQVLAGRYRVARVVSSGANTVLVDAIDLESDGQVTVKIVRPEHAQDPEFRRKFHRLAEISNALTHPNIASVSDWGEIELAGESTVFWTVDALGGGSLRDLLDRGRTLEPGQVLVLGLEACRALDAAHQKGLYHTELTPSKMVFGADRRLRVVDFGMARLLAESAWADASAVPTHVARYASPEQALGLPIDAKTDVYALALVMIEAVTGNVPFDADSTVATLAGRVDKLMPVSADLGALASVLERAGRPESADRFTAAEFGRALVQAAPKLPKPEPIPILSTGQFDTTAMRRPTDPTGGVERPAPVAGLAGVKESGAAVAAAAAAAVGAAAAVAETPAPIDAATADPATEPEVAAEPEGTESDSGVDGAQAADPVVAELAAAQLAEIVASDDESDAEPDDSDAEPDAEPDAAEDSSTGEVDPPAWSEPDPEADVVETSASDDLRINDAATEVIPALEATPPLEATRTMAVTAGDDGGAGEPTPPEIFDDAPRKRRRGPLILLVIVLLAGLGALGYAGSLLLAPKSFDVPVLAGVPEDQALNQIAGNDWDITIERERSDSFPELDTVIRTLPEAGVELEEGEPFTLVLSDGPKFRTLPEIAGLPFNAAVTQLASLGLVGIEGFDREFSETEPADSVISWQVQGDVDASMQTGAQILPGETIEMTLSKGPAPRGVPNLSGQTLEGATAALDALQLVISQGEDLFSEDIPAGTVVAQDPTPESSVERGAIVTVQLSKGPDRIEFPSLEGLSYVDAEALLVDQLGFSIGSLLGTTEGRFVEATIGGEDVAAGALFPRGQAIDLIFL